MMKTTMMIMIHPYTAIHAAAIPDAFSGAALTPLGGRHKAPDSVVWSLARIIHNSVCCENIIYFRQVSTETHSVTRWCWWLWKFWEIILAAFVLYRNLPKGLQTSQK